MNKKNKYFTPGFFKFLLGFSLLILASFAAMTLFGGGGTPPPPPDTVAAPSS
ncbi:MAG: hypothetical protein AAB923_00860 [Patescibacteria group bacterium]